MEQISRTVKDFILKEFLPGENPDALTYSTELMTSGVLDSLATLKLVAFLEEDFQIEIEAHEVDVDHANTINDIAKLVAAKLARKAGG